MSDNINIEIIEQPIQVSLSEQPIEIELCGSLIGQGATGNQPAGGAGPV